MEREVNNLIWDAYGDLEDDVIAVLKMVEPNVNGLIEKINPHSVSHRIAAIMVKKINETIPRIMSEREALFKAYTTLGMFVYLSGDHLKTLDDDDYPEGGCSFPMGAGSSLTMDQHEFFSDYARPIYEEAIRVGYIDGQVVWASFTHIAGEYHEGRQTHASYLEFTRIDHEITKMGIAINGGSREQIEKEQREWEEYQTSCALDR